MPFLIQGKTNWKYVIIVLILAVIVGGGILGWIKTKEVLTFEFSDIKKPEKAEGEKIKVEVYFSNPELYNKLQNEICPGEYCPKEMYERYGTDDCGYFFPIIREIPKPKTETELVHLLLGELLKGPTKEEQEQGFKLESPFIEMIKSFEIKEATLSIRLDEEKITEWEKRISPRTFYSLASCEWKSYIGSLERTLEQNLKIELEIIPSPM